MASAELVQKGLTKYLGIEDSIDDSTNIFTDNADVHKVHTKRFCDNLDVDCEELKDGLIMLSRGGNIDGSSDGSNNNDDDNNSPSSQSLYQCLYKQLTMEREGHTWTVPMMKDGTISIEGDCMPIQPLSADKYIRSLSELYKIPT